MRLSIFILLANTLLAQTEYDLLLKGAQVIDPKNKRNSVLDVAIRDGLIAAVAVGAAALIALGGSALATTSAEAHPGGWGPGAAIGAGVLGVAIGASLAHPYYGPPPGAYAGPGYYGYYGGCRAYWRWSPRYGRYLRQRACY